MSNIKIYLLSHLPVQNNLLKLVKKKNNKCKNKKNRLIKIKNSTKFISPKKI